MVVTVLVFCVCQAFVGNRGERESSRKRRDAILERVGGEGVDGGRERSRRKINCGSYRIIEKEREGA